MRAVLAGWDCPNHGVSCVSQRLDEQWQIEGLGGQSTYRTASGDRGPVRAVQQGKATACLGEAAGQL